MQFKRKAAARVFSMILKIVMLMGAFPVSVMAETIDDPLTGVTGNG